MSSKEVRIVLEGEDNLSPVAKKVAEAIAQLKTDSVQADQEIVKLKSNIRDLNSAKSSAKKGLFDTEIIESKTLKAELDALIAKYSQLSAQKSKASKVELKDTSAQIDKAYTQAINEQRTAIDNLMLKKRNLNSTMAENVTHYNNAVKATKDQTKATRDYDKATSSVTNSVVRHIRQMESMLVAIYAIKQAYDVTLGVGLDYNILLENEKRGLAAVYMSKLSDVDASGKQIAVVDKWKMSQDLASGAFEKLLELNKETPHTLGETIQLYRVLAGSSLQWGASQEELLELTKLLSIAASAQGVAFQPLLASMDGIASGSVVASSDLGKMLGSLGLTNEALKEAAKTGSQFTLVLDKLKDFAIAGKQVQGEWAGIVSNMKTQWDMLWGDIQKPIFEELKKDMTSFTTYLEQNREEVKKNVDSFVEWMGIITLAGSSLWAASKILKAYPLLVSASAAANTMFAGSFGAVNASIVLTAASTRSLSLAMKAIPFIGIAAAIYGVADALLTSSKNSDMLNESMSTGGKNLERLTKQQLEYQKVLVDRAVLEASLELNKARATTGTTYLFDNEEKHKRDLSNLDTTRQKFEELKTISSKINDLLTKRNVLIEEGKKSTEDPKFKNRDEEELKNIEKLFPKEYTSDIEGKKAKLYARYQEATTQIHKDNVGAKKLLDTRYNEELAILNSESQKKAQSEAEKLQKAWADRSFDISYNMAIAQQDAMSKPYIELQRKYDEDLKEFASVKGAKEKLEEEYNAKLQALNQKTVEEFEKETKDALEKDKQEKKQAIEHELKMLEEQYRIQSRQVSLLDDEVDRTIALAKIEHDRSVQSLRLQMEKEPELKALYEMELDYEDKLLAKTIENYSLHGQVINGIKDNLESGFGEFFDMQSQNFMDFGNLATDILHEIYMEIVKISLVKPLASSLTSSAMSLIPSLFGGGASAVTANSDYWGSLIENAKGGTYSSASLSQYSNQVVSSPTLFAFASGGVPNMGVFGEAGSEAIMPLTRTTGGDLGVKAVGGVQNMKIEIINQTSQGVEVSSATQRMDTDGMVLSIVIDGINKNKYGLRDMIGGR